MKSQWLSPRSVPTAPSSERRYQTRVTSPVKAWCRGSSRTTFRRVTTVDVSPGGVCLESPTPVPSGGSLTVTLNLDSRVVAFEGRVVWSRWEKDRARLGVSFERGALADEQALLNWVYRQR